MFAINVCFVTCFQCFSLLAGFFYKLQTDFHKILLVGSVQSPVQLATYSGWSTMDF